MISIFIFTLAILIFGGFKSWIKDVKLNVSYMLVMQLQPLKSEGQSTLPNSATYPVLQYLNNSQLFIATKQERICPLSSIAFSVSGASFRLDSLLDTYLKQAFAIFSLPQTSLIYHLIFLFSEKHTIIN